MSGRTPPSSPLRRLTWVEKSQCSTMPGELDHALELQLAPAPADLRRAQGVDQLAGLAAELLGAGGHGAHLLAQPRVGRLALPLDRAQLALDALQRRRHRVEQLRRWPRRGPRCRRRPWRQRGRGLLDPALGQRDELLGVVRPTRRPTARERLLQLDVAAGEQLLPTGGAVPLALQRGLGGRRRGLRRGAAARTPVVLAAELVEPRAAARRARPAGCGGVGAQRDRTRRPRRGPAAATAARCAQHASSHPARRATPMASTSSSSGNDIHAVRVHRGTDSSGRRATSRRRTIGGRVEHAVATGARQPPPRGPAATASPAAPSGSRRACRRCAAPGGTARTAPPRCGRTPTRPPRTAAGRPALAAYSV